MNALKPPARLMPGHGEAGYVTAETALVLPTLVGLGLALAFVVTAAGEQIRCADAAFETARSLARGESVASAAQTAHRLAPRDAAISVAESAGAVSVRVTARLAFGRTLLPVLRLEGLARVDCEPSVPCGQPAAQGGG